VAVKYFEELVVLNLSQFLSRNRPAKVGMVDVGDPLRHSYSVDVALQSVDNRDSPLRRYELSQIQSIQVEGFVTKFVRDLFPFDHKKTFVGTV